MDVKEVCFEESVKVLERCSTNHGFHAAFPGYDAVWSRDANIISIGASLLGDKFKNTFKQSLITLESGQSEKGQIPNAVDKFSKRKPHVDFQTVDSSLWFVIGHHLYKKRYNDSSLFKKHKKQIKKALLWVSYQDLGNDYMPEQQPTSDWQDAFPHRYGHTINTQALYYHSLILEGQKKTAEKVKHSANKVDDIRLWNGTFYDSYRWKNHNKYQEKSDWFDSLGNLLAILFDLADKKQARSILNYIERKKIARPYPMRSIDPPLRKGTKYWYDYFEDCDARTPYHYINGGIWTYIGAFYVLALIKMGDFKKAEHELTLVAEANLKNPMFSEWLHGLKGTVGPSANGYKDDGNQGWNAGVYVLAYESLKKKKVLL